MSKKKYVFCRLCNQDMYPDYFKGHLFNIHKFSVYWIENEGIESFIGERPK